VHRAPRAGGHHHTLPRRRHLLTPTTSGAHGAQASPTPTKMARWADPDGFVAVSRPANRKSAECRWRQCLDARSYNKEWIPTNADLTGPESRWRRPPAALLAIRRAGHWLNAARSMGPGCSIQCEGPTTEKSWFQLSTAADATYFFAWRTFLDGRVHFTGIGPPIRLTMRLLLVNKRADAIPGTKKTSTSAKQTGKLSRFRLVGLAAMHCCPDVRC